MRKKCQNGVWLRADATPELRLYFSPPCKLKRCPDCQKLRRLQHYIKIMACIHNHQNMNWYFITMTNRDYVHRTGDTELSLKTLRHAWAVYRKRLNRHVGQLFWVKVYELHKSGIYHLHTIVGTDKPLTYDWLHDNLFQTGFGYIFDRQKLEYPRHVRYIIKYAVKSDIPIRAIEYSRNFPKIDSPESEEVLDWQYLGNINIDIATQWDEVDGIRWRLLTEPPDDEIAE